MSNAETLPGTRARSRDLIEQNGAAIRALRQKDGYTAETFAAQVGASYSHYRNIENGHRLSSPELLNRIARALGVPLAAILRDPAVADYEALLHTPTARRKPSSPFGAATPEASAQAAAS